MRSHYEHALEERFTPPPFSPRTFPTIKLPTPPLPPQFSPLSTIRPDARPQKKEETQYQFLFSRQLFPVQTPKEPGSIAPPLPNPIPTFLPFPPLFPPRGPASILSHKRLPGRHISPMWFVWHPLNGSQWHPISSEKTRDSVLSPNDFFRFLDRKKFFLFSPAFYSPHLMKGTTITPAGLPPLLKLAVFYPERVAVGNYQLTVVFIPLQMVLLRGIPEVICIRPFLNPYNVSSRLTFSEDGCSDPQTSKAD